MAVPTSGTAQGNSPPGPCLGDHLSDILDYIVPSSTDVVIIKAVIIISFSFSSFAL